MTCTVIFEMREKPGGRPALKALLQEFLPVTRTKEGCISIEAYGNADVEGILCVEQWETRQLYDAYIGWRMERGDIERVLQLCAEQPSVRFFDKMDA